MKISLTTFAMAQLAGLASCAPGSDLEGRKTNTFSLKQVKNEKFRAIDAPTALLDVYAKYGKPIPKAMQKAMEINPDLSLKFKNRLAAAGSVTASVPNYPAPYYDSQYVVPVQIGTPPQNMYLNLDTGSADFWVFSTDTYAPLVRGHTLYRPKNSSTSKRLKGQSWSVLYGDGASAGGIVYTDKVSLGATSFNTQAIQSAVQVSAAISADSFASGILGMGRTKANTVRPTQQRTYIENIQSELREPVFTVDLQPQKPGTYDFGWISTRKHTGSIKYVPTDPNSPYWEFTVDGYKIGKDSKELRPYRFQAIADTGTTLLLLPTGMVNDYYSKVKGADLDPYSGMMIVPCSADLPDWVIALGSYRGVVPGHYISYGNMNSTHCYGGIQSSDGIGFAIVGDVFLKAQFAVFDIGRSRIGFANKPTTPKP